MYKEIEIEIYLERERLIGSNRYLLDFCQPNPPFPHRFAGIIGGAAVALRLQSSAPASRIFSISSREISNPVF